MDICNVAVLNNCNEVSPCLLCNNYLIAFALGYAGRRHYGTWGVMHPPPFQILLFLL